jgi:hypothetical protein
MDKVVMISHAGDNGNLGIQVRYFISDLAEVQTICCEIAGPPFPQWLKMKKFELLSLHKGNNYERIFNENNQTCNLQTDLFMDDVYKAIMSQ